VAVNPLTYYLRRDVAEEIASFLRGRWAALEGSERRWIRWLEDKPLTVDSWDDVPYYVRRFHWIGARTFYGTIEVFRRIESREDVEDRYEANVAQADAFIDIDVVDDSKVEQAWRFVVKAAKVVVDELSSLGISRSVYLVWSGAGMHIRVPGRAFRRVLEEAHPIDVAFALTEYVLRRVGGKLRNIVRESGGLIKVENLVAVKRVFTAPLSLHRKLERVAVALYPDELADFNLEWSDPEKPVHRYKAWERAVEGEADEAASEALRVIGRARVGSAPVKATRIEEFVASAQLATRSEEPIEAIRGREVREPGRFQVMALLQAARYYLLTGDFERAKSWGLNRAIFYAWAKHYGPSHPGYRLLRLDRRLKLAERSGSTRRRCPEGMVEVLGECVQRGPRGLYLIGGTEQTPRDFDREVTSKLAGLFRWEDVWKAALEYVSSFPRTVLEDPSKFFKYVYEPVRDTFFAQLLRGEKPRPPPQLLERLHSLERALAKARRSQPTLEAFMSSRARSSREAEGSSTADQPQRASQQESEQPSS
jgi:hypothetical protein